MATDQALLDEVSAVGYLVERGVFRSAEGLAVKSLGGGVSNIVLLVSGADRRVVIKQSLPRLRVQTKWLAKRERVLTEAAALELAADLSPGSVPAVLDI